jgi:hypothetical protein
MINPRVCAAVLATMLISGSVSGCTSTVEGSALPAAALGHANPTSGTTSPTPHTVDAGALESALLPRDQVVALVGGANMAAVMTITNTSDASSIIDDRSCVGVGSIADASVYSGSGWVAMRGNQLTTPNVVQADVTQVITSFPAPADADALLQQARAIWQGCANRRYGFHSSNGNHSFLDTGPVKGSVSRIEVLLRQEEDPRWACTHAMAALSATLTEVRVCLLSKDSSAAANNLLDQVLARIPG